MAVVFISYRRKDTAGHAGRLHEALTRRYGRDSVFMDIDSIAGGAKFRELIHDTLNKSDAVVVLIGEDWTAPSGTDPQARRIDREDDLVRREVAAALEHEEVTVIPVLVEGASLPAADELPEDLSSLRGLHVCQLRNGDWRPDVRRIARAIDSTNQATRVDRVKRLLRERPGWVAGALALLAALAVVVAVLASGGGGGGEGCENGFIAKDSREELAVAAKSSQPAEEGTVYYGTCGSEAYALASFPDGSDGVFVQSGLHWDDLGPIAAEKCDQVPPELLRIWHKDDGC